MARFDLSTRERPNGASATPETTGAAHLLSQLEGGEISRTQSRTGQIRADSFWTFLSGRQRMSTWVYSEPVRTRAKQNAV